MLYSSLGHTVFNPKNTNEPSLYIYTCTIYYMCIIIIILPTQSQDCLNSMIDTCSYGMSGLLFRRFTTYMYMYMYIFCHTHVHVSVVLYIHASKVIHVDLIKMFTTLFRKNKQFKCLVVYLLHFHIFILPIASLLSYSTCTCIIIY